LPQAKPMNLIWFRAKRSSRAVGPLLKSRPWRDAPQGPHGRSFFPEPYTLSFSPLFAPCSSLFAPLHPTPDTLHFAPCALCPAHFFKGSPRSNPKGAPCTPAASRSGPSLRRPGRASARGAPRNDRRERSPPVRHGSGGRRNSPPHPGGP
jgi:hypothetical protein